MNETKRFDSIAALILLLGIILNERDGWIRQEEVEYVMRCLYSCNGDFMDIFKRKSWNELNPKSIKRLKKNYFLFFLNIKYAAIKEMTIKNKKL